MKSVWKEPGPLLLQNILSMSSTEFVKISLFNNKWHNTLFILLTDWLPWSHYLPIKQSRRGKSQSDKSPVPVGWGYRGIWRNQLWKSSLSSDWISKHPGAAMGRPVFCRWLGGAHRQDGSGQSHNTHAKSDAKLLRVLAKVLVARRREKLHRHIRREEDRWRFLLLVQHSGPVPEPGHLTGGGVDQQCRHRLC